ncbi:hypothetical protein PspCFBP13506_07440 [Pseudomonas sp. CFBP13506]|uniref:Uncharacterized protein n=1 Tax=Pseudomonas fluorescens TaxID=294 RepID=A0A4Y9THQ1_PSEFL|nr:hypothetical protein E4T65_14155 [Pseudomonas fluorescens]TKJ64356.1 hypothetical protein PspCFBP13506_07440 [Pseudomonas sp. CFBP13506]
MASLFIGALASLWAAPLRRTSIVRRVNPQASGQAMGKREQMLQNRAHSPRNRRSLAQARRRALQKVARPVYKWLAAVRKSSSKALSRPS